MAYTIEPNYTFVPPTYHTLDEQKTPEWIEAERVSNLTPDSEKDEAYWAAYVARVTAIEVTAG
jgi:hypothetical protein